MSGEDFSIFTFNDPTRSKSEVESIYPKIFIYFLAKKAN